jgi:hypothetical protein
MLVIFPFSRRLCKTYTRYSAFLSVLARCPLVIPDIFTNRGSHSREHQISMDIHGHTRETCHCGRCGRNSPFQAILATSSKTALPCTHLPLSLILCCKPLTHSLAQRASHQPHGHNYSLTPTSCACDVRPSVLYTTQSRFPATSGDSQCAHVCRHFCTHRR